MGCLGCCNNNDESGHSASVGPGQRRRRGSPRGATRQQAPQQLSGTSGMAPIIRQAHLREENQPQIAPLRDSYDPEVVYPPMGEKISTSRERQPRSAASTDKSLISPPATGRPKVAASSGPSRPQTIYSTRDVESSASRKKPQNPSTSAKTIPITPKATGREEIRPQVTSAGSPRQQTAITTIAISPFAIYNQQFPPTTAAELETVRPLSSARPLAAQRLQSPPSAFIRQQAVIVESLSTVLRDIRQQKLTDASGKRTSPPRSGGGCGQMHGTNLQLRPEVSGGPSTSPRRGAEVSTRLPKSLPPQATGAAGLSGTLRSKSSIAAWSSSGLPSQRSTSAGSSTSPEDIRSMRVGIETEFVLTARSSDHVADSREDFVAMLASNHNREVDSTNPRMHHSLVEHYLKQDYAMWNMVTEPTIEEKIEPPWGVELVSPIFDVHPGSTWRDSYAATWNYLQRHYIINITDLCSTHIHVSLIPHYKMTDLKRVACAVIHFEPAFEALVPPERIGNAFVKSNWLDSPCLAEEGLSRFESFAVIERAQSTSNLIKTMQKPKDKCFGWNFECLDQHGTIEFRKPPASLTSTEALSWAELALNFIQAAIKYGTAERLRSVPATITGLRWFLGQVNIPTITEPSRLNRIWAGKEVHAALEPEVIPKQGSNLNLAMDERLRKKSEADEKRIRKQATSTRGPYWQR